MIDWQAFLRRLDSHPQEASIVCPSEEGLLLFPLEAVVQFRAHSEVVPLEVAQRLLHLCPKAVEFDDSMALAEACLNRYLAGPEIVLSILRANPALAATCPSAHNADEWAGVPLLHAVCLPYADQVLPALIQAYPQGLSKTNSFDQMPLHVAVDRNDLPTSTLRLLLAEGQPYGVGASNNFDRNGGQILIRSHIESGESDHERRALYDIVIRARTALGRYEMDRWVGRHDMGELEETPNTIRTWQNFLLCIHESLLSRAVQML